MQSPLEAVRNERQWHQWVLNHWALAATFGQSISLRFFWLDARDRLCPRAVHGNRENRECNSMEQPETFMQQRVSGNECHQGLSYVFPQFHECHVIAMWLLYRLPVYKECHGTMAQEEVNLLLCGCVWQTRLVALCWLRQRIRRHLSESCNMPTSVVASDSLHPSEFVRIRPNPSESVRIHPYRSYRNPLTISSAGRLRSTEAVIWRVRRTGIVSANSTDLPCLNFEPDDLDISPVIRCLLYFILFYYDPPIPLEMLLFPGLWWEQNAPEPTSSCSALSENAAKGCNGLCSNIKHKSPERQVTWRSGSLQSYFSNVSCVFVIVPLYFYT